MERGIPQNEEEAKRMISTDGVELFLGMRIDLNFGPLILFGAGGHLVEALRDQGIGFSPLNTTLAKRLMCVAGICLMEPPFPSARSGRKMNR